LKGSKKALVLDASVLIEMAYATELGEKAKKLIEERLAYTTELAIAETYYILCRKIGPNNAREKIENLLDSGYLSVLHIDPLSLGRIKCERAISLADSYVIALARKIKGVALFARKEKELAEETKKRGFEVDILFLEEL